MEKKIKFDDVIDFIYKALKMKYYVTLCGSGSITIGHEMKYLDTEGSKQTFNCYSFAWNFVDNNLIITLDTSYVRDDLQYQLKIENKKDIARWNILIEDVKEYVFNKIEDKFNNFFKEEKSHIDINDLDDEND